MYVRCIVDARARLFVCRYIADHDGIFATSTASVWRRVHVTCSRYVLRRPTMEVSLRRYRRKWETTPRWIWVTTIATDTATISTLFQLPPAKSLMSITSCSPAEGSLRVFRSLKWIGFLRPYWTTGQKYGINRFKVLSAKSQHSSSFGVLWCDLVNCWWDGIK